MIGLHQTAKLKEKSETLYDFSSYMHNDLLAVQWGQIFYDVALSYWIQQKIFLKSSILYNTRFKAAQN